MNIANSVVVITGASSGIGRAAAIELASRGARVVVASRDPVALAEVVRECEEAGGEALAFTVDVTHEEEVATLARRAITHFGGIDVWINNAAVALFAKFGSAPSNVYRRVIDTNFFGYVHGARAALQHFRERHRGILINIDSVTAGAPQPYTSAYVASKYAIRGWSACLRMELSLEKEKEIHVCSVLPAAIDTPLFQHAANFTGRAVKALDPVYPAEKVAKAIAGVIESPRAEVVVGAAGKLIMANRAAAPRMFDRLFARQVDRNHLQDRPAAQSAGNLFDTKAPKSVDGGWRRRQTVTAKVRRGGWPMAVAVIAVAAFAMTRSYGRGKAS